MLPEAKHQYFKDFMRRNKCLKNSSLSMANQHQLYQSYMVGGSLLTKEEQGVIKKEASSDAPFRNILPATCRTITSVSWISIDGVTYKPEKCFVRTNFINTQPYFGLLYKILYFEENPVFVCKTVHTVEHDLHFNSYEISINEEFKMYNLNELFVHTVYHSHKVEQILHSREEECRRHSLGWRRHQYIKK